jgi:ATP-dependent RNA helicase DDX55/SPB4
LSYFKTQAVTGSGKTLAFLIPMVSRLLRLEEPTKRHHIGGIIVTPTRELASQIHGVLVSLLGFHAASAELLPYLQGLSDEKRPMTAAPVIVPQLLVGGSLKASQDISFFLKQSPNLLVGTPVSYTALHL